MSDKMFKKEEDISNKAFEGLKLLEPYKRKVEDLDYAKGLPGLKKASSKQRGFIHGLSSKAGVDEDTFDVPTKDMTVIEASEMIEYLRELTASTDDAYKAQKEANAGNFYGQQDSELPF